LVRCVTVITGGHPAIIVGFLSQNLTTMAVAVAFRIAWAEAEDGSRTGADHADERLAGFRGELYRCLARRPDALSGLCDAVLCRQSRVQMLRYRESQLLRSTADRDDAPGRHSAGPGRRDHRRALLGARLGEEILAGIREQFTTRVLALPLPEVEQAGTGDLLTHSTYNLQSLSNAVRLAAPAILAASQR
jgi:hypothetical protein